MLWFVLQCNCCQTSANLLLCSETNADLWCWSYMRVFITVLMAWQLKQWSSIYITRHIDHYTHVWQAHKYKHFWITSSSSMTRFFHMHTNAQTHTPTKKMVLFSMLRRLMRWNWWCLIFTDRRRLAEQRQSYLLLPLNNITSINFSMFDSWCALHFSCT